MDPGIPARRDLDHMAEIRSNRNADKAIDRAEYLPGIDAYGRDHMKMTLHIDGENLNDRLNVLDFGGLFSGNAIAPQRSILVRWESRF
jgi:hypothetical protein